MHYAACVCVHRARNCMCTRTWNSHLPLTRLLSFLLTLLLVFVFSVCHSKINMESGVCCACLSLTWGLGRPEPLPAKP